MFSHSIPKICCITDVEFSIKIISQNVNIIHESSSSGALNPAIGGIRFRACLLYIVWYRAMHPIG